MTNKSFEGINFLILNNPLDDKECQGAFEVEGLPV
jgi:hypothetical protein